MKNHWRFVMAAVLLSGTALLLQARSGSEIIPARTALESFPQTLPGWKATNVALSKEVLDVLGPGDFLLRRYSDGGRNASVDLFVAYFPSQRAGDTIHSPKNCLPGAGWAPVHADRISIDVPGQASFTANRYLIAKGDERELVLYWYWAHNRAVASEYAAKFYLVTDSIRMHRTDGSLVRVSTSLPPSQNLESAQQVLLAFVSKIAPLMNTYVPR
jgi:EpsI family protein